MMSSPNVCVPGYKLWIFWSLFRFRGVCLPFLVHFLNHPFLVPFHLDFCKQNTPCIFFTFESLLLSTVFLGIILVSFSLSCIFAVPSHSFLPGINLISTIYIGIVITLSKTICEDESFSSLGNARCQLARFFLPDSQNICST
jgi:hypothetical protein